MNWLAICKITNGEHIHHHIDLHEHNFRWTFFFFCNYRFSMIRKLQVITFILMHSKYFNGIWFFAVQNNCFGSGCTTLFEMVIWCDPKNRRSICWYYTHERWTTWRIMGKVSECELNHCDFENGKPNIPKTQKKSN